MRGVWGLKIPKGSKNYNELVNATLHKAKLTSLRAMSGVSGAEDTLSE